MSLYKCDLCYSIQDTDENPDGFYVKGHENEYICPTCVENNNLEYEV